MAPSESILEAVRVELSKIYEPQRRQLFVGIHGDEKPPARSGQFYISLHTPTWSQVTESNAGIDDHIGLSISISQRTGVVPLDKMRAALWKPRVGAMSIFHQIRQTLYVKRHVVREYAVRLLKEGIDGYGGSFCEPLRIQSGRLQAVQVGPAHFRADPCEHPQGKKTTCQEHGVLLTLQYGQARYLNSTLNAAGTFTAVC